MASKRASTDKLLTRLEKRLAKRQEASEAKLAVAHDSLKAELIKVQESLKGELSNVQEVAVARACNNVAQVALNADLFLAQEAAQLRTNALQESFKKDFMEAREVSRNRVAGLMLGGTLVALILYEFVGTRIHYIPLEAEDKGCNFESARFIIH